MTGGQNVLADPQFSMATVLRPFDGFEAVYEGKAATQEIAFFPPDENGAPMVLDAEAGKNGISPNLLRYTPVPLGSRILVYIPHAITWQESIPSPIIETQYTYSFHWRIRNLESARSNMGGGGQPKPYHSRTFKGRPDTTAPAESQQRFVIPAATRSVVVEQAEAAAGVLTQQIQHLRRERIQLVTTYTDNGVPLLPNGNEGEHMQGVLDPGQFQAANLEWIAKSALFVPFEFRCEGDELCITANRYDAWNTDPTPDPWTFGELDAPDAPFSNVYGTNVLGPTQERSRGIGIYLFTGG